MSILINAFSVYLVFKEQLNLMLEILDFKNNEYGNHYWFEIQIKEQVTNSII